MIGEMGELTIGVKIGGWKKVKGTIVKNKNSSIFAAA